ncbi:MAG TPA: hypothetical protein PKL73_05945 [Polyangiaceae bacterium]|mgnify:CR=1 FL=1|jgi:hypothetical protein|nr:MAG: hypothetical protein BWY17_01001 [Deltaproteobacteria bacterium ADurb.Bin207]HNS96473.1 hypothetical protein [Polyangiaceae bacterium]HNZ21401.1 hypothetical protein [Polyangiaceae bacterium]HOD23278.1 hypothetical protein [Polyangiaceae bacterium]HOE47422.1 hypothetical protein [Polyangiaceae bacterium]
MKRYLPLSLIAFALVACETNEQPNPAPTVDIPVDAAAETTIIDVFSEDVFLPPTEAGPFRRSVLLRSPFGNLAHTDNLLLDGDMEMSVAQGQTPWRVLGLGGQVSVPVETGGRCRSGLRCIALSAKANAAFGVGVAARNLPLEFWLWAKTPGACSALTVYMFSAMTMNITQFHQVQADNPQPDASGWCRFSALRSASDESIGIYVEAKVTSVQQILIDDAVLRPADASSPTTKGLIAVRPQVHQRIVNRLAPWMRQRWIGPPPPWPQGP